MESIKELRQKCGVKTNKNSPWRRRFGRHISLYIMKVLLLTNITANQVTFFMFIFGLIAIELFMVGNYFLNLIALFFLQVSFLLDECDGEIARYRNNCSVKGIFYDLMHHIIINPLLILAISIGAYFNNPLPIPNYVFLVFGIMGMYLLLLSNLIEAKKYEAYLSFNDYKGLKNMRQKVVESKKRSTIRDFFKIEIFNAFFFFGLFNVMYLLVFIYGIIIPLNFIRNLYLTKI